MEKTGLLGCEERQTEKILGYAFPSTKHSADRAELSLREKLAIVPNPTSRDQVEGFCTRKKADTKIKSS